jgi:hypothetical protein
MVVNGWKLDCYRIKSLQWTGSEDFACNGQLTTIPLSRLADSPDIPLVPSVFVLYFIRPSQLVIPDTTKRGHWFIFLSLGVFGYFVCRIVMENQTKITFVLFMKLNTCVLSDQIRSI